MNSQQKLCLTITVTLLGGLTSGCVFDDMEPCPDTSRVTIANDWNNAPDADPEGIAYLFFSPGERDPWRYDFPGREAGKIDIPLGKYNFVMFNHDTSHIDFKFENNGEVYVSTADTHIAALPDSTVFEGERISKAPDMLWSDAIDNIEVMNFNLIYNGHCHGDMVLKTHPRQVTPHYTVTVKHVENLHGVAATSGALSGQSSGLCLNPLTRSSEEVTIPFEPRVSPDSTVVAEFMSFGIVESVETESRLSLFFQLSDGRKIKSVHNVTNQIHNSSDPMDIRLVVDSINLPWAPPAVSGAGFVPWVGGWVEINVNYGE